MAGNLPRPQNVEVQETGTSIGTRKKLNFLSTGDHSISATDNPSNESIDIGIAVDWLTVAIHRSKTVNLIAGSNVVSFTEDIGCSDYTLFLIAYLSDGTITGVDPVPAQTSAGFTIGVGEACILKYLAIPSH